MWWLWGWAAHFFCSGKLRWWVDLLWGPHLQICLSCPRQSHTCWGRSWPMTEHSGGRSMGASPFCSVAHYDGHPLPGTLSQPGWNALRTVFLLYPILLPSLCSPRCQNCAMPWSLSVPVLLGFPFLSHVHLPRSISWTSNSVILFASCRTWTDTASILESLHV